MIPKIACAIYTRKSSEEGLEQEFNSLDAQREACEAYILSQKHQGWKALPTRYDDGGYSGGTLERPGVQRLLADIEQGKIQVVVVYKVDRLTRSLADFAKIVERLDAQGVSFVSVTQQFNTTTSMGRLTLNVLLSFAQFEREVTGERIRDKIAASKKKGMWMGGVPPIGYLARERNLVVDPDQADLVRRIFLLYRELGSVRLLREEVDRRGWTTAPREGKRNGGRPFSRGHLYRILNNPIYVGRVPHKKISHPGQHPPIIAQPLWDEVQALLDSNRVDRAERVTAEDPSLLVGITFDESGERLTPTHTRKGVRRYRYYVSRNLHVFRNADADDGLRIPAQELEGAVIKTIVNYLADESRLLGDAKLEDASAVKELIRDARTLARDLENGSTRECMAILKKLLQRVVVGRDQLQLILTGNAILSGGTDIALTVPTLFHKHGKGIRMVVRAHNKDMGNVDRTLVQLLERSRNWFDRFTKGGDAALKTIAADEGVMPFYVTRVMYLAFLAPDIAQAIHAGSQPSRLTADKLMRLMPLPIRWDEQRRLLGLAPATT